MARLSIIMYHYVRELSKTRYPEIKGLTVHKFKQQLDFLQKSYHFVSVDDCLNAIYEDAPLPKNAVLLTFDDGYSEHFSEVFPILQNRGIQGAFFPPVQAIFEHQVLDVNKIHFILAAAQNHQKLANRIKQRITELQSEFQLQSPDYYYQKLADSEHRYDPKEVVFIKRILQRELPEKPRKIILDKLFDEYINIDEKTFAKELYVDMEQLRCMRRHDMFIGGHGYSHRWLNVLNEKEQKFEIEKTKRFLSEIGIEMDRWVMCYPYGAYNNKLINLLKKENCAIGIGTEVGDAQLSRENAFTLQRFDTNDLQDLIEGKKSILS